MPTYIRINLEGVKPIERRINGVIGKLKDLRKGFKKIAEDFRETEERVFNAQGAYGSRAGWKPLTPKYKAWKDKTYPGKRILHLKGTLRESLTKKGANHIEIINKRTLTIGSNDPKFKWHQKGTRKMSKRPPIVFTEYQGEKWGKILRDEILSGVKK